MEDKRKIFQLAQENLHELFQTIIMNLLQEVDLLKENIGNPYSKTVEDSLGKLDQRNDNYSIVVHNLLLQRIFLTIDKYDLQLVYESFELVMDKIQQVGHRLGLITIPEWVTIHLTKMLNHLNNSLTELSSWFEDELENINLRGIQVIENSSDLIHRKFLRKLYMTELPHPEFFQSEFIDLTIENCIDEVLKLAKRVFVILDQMKAYTPDPPTYLS